MLYLDFHGLSHFWDKIVEWLSGPSSGLAHRTGDEIVGGVKTFRNTSPGRVEGETVTDLIIRNPEVTRGTPLEDGNSFTSIIFADAEGDAEETFAGRLAILRVLSPKVNGDSGSQLSLRCYKYTADPQELEWASTLTIGYDTDGIPFVSAASTSALRDNGNDVVTRNWIPKDTRIVHTTGAETVDGQKTFTGALRLGSSSSGGIVCSADSANSAMEVDVYGASVFDDGAVLRVFGKNHQYNPGYFICRAATSSSDAKQLAGKPDGTLTWDGQPLQTSSDGRLKTKPEAVPDAVLDAWGDVEWRRFKYLDAVARKGAGARFHTGLVAQQVRDAFAARGLDACEYGILCYDGDADLWTVRYAEACAMEAAYQRRRLDRLEALLSRSGSEG